MTTLDERNVECFKQFTKNSIAFMKNYVWISDAYVSDFFFKQHWERLPKTWQTAIPGLSTSELSFLLERDPAPLRQVVPLSLMSFKVCCDTYSLKRRCGDDIEGQIKLMFQQHKHLGKTVKDQTIDLVSENEKSKQIIPILSDGKLHAYFRKHVKPKKQHEINNLSMVIYLLTKQINCDNLVDVGSGLGHLARVLSFGYGLNVTSVEAANSHAPKAQKYDKEIDREIKKKKMKQSSVDFNVVNESCSLPSHVTSMIYPNMSSQEFVSIIKSNQNPGLTPIISNCSRNVAINTESGQCTSAHNTSCDTDWKFALTGLHACGDLTPTLLRFFTNCENCCGLASVGCCYMKMSDESSNVETIGYPMSEYISSIPGHRQTYAARELACHFAETYSRRLKECPPHLKIHSYRAALEWLANMLSPTFQRTAVQIPCGKTFNMQFERYARLGLSKLGIPDDKLTDSLLHEACQMTERWKDVVAFYTIRLALAPVIETLILLDRMIFLFEKGHASSLVPVFDPELSPRNFVLLSWKNRFN